MKRWNFNEMLEIANKLFAKIFKKKRLARHNHEIHVLSRERDQWMSDSIQSMINGTYTPRNLRRIYFPDETVDQLHLTDRILQNVLLKQLKPTFPHVINPNCLHLQGPHGIKIATQRIREILEKDKPNFLLRVDIRSYYSSIPHYKLKADIKKYYDDPRVQDMLIRVIDNPILTPRGFQNPSTGIALRGPLSQFFSALYLKPLDDTLSRINNIKFLRYADDILILCQSKKQMNHCKRKMMEILAERRLKLSRKKSRMGCIKSGFHFLGVSYDFGTQPQNNTRVARAKNDCSILPINVLPPIPVDVLNNNGGGSSYQSFTTCAYTHNASSAFVA